MSATPRRTTAKRWITLLMQGNTGAGAWADSAYRSEAMEAKLHDMRLKSHIHRKGKRASR